MNGFYDIAIIGAGASGMTAGIVAKRNNPGLSVAIFEKKDVAGTKLSLTGKGKCNISNANCQNNDMVIDFLKSIGIDIIKKDEGRLYPADESAENVVNKLKNAAKALGIEIYTGKAITKLEKTCGADFTLEINEKESVGAGKVLLATGGKSYPKCGTTGDGYVFARNMGHKIATLIPGLTGFETLEDTKNYHGIRAKGLAILKCAGEIIFEEHGEIQFARGVLSGIVMMNMSLDYRNDGKKYEIELKLDDPSIFGTNNLIFHPVGLRGWKEAQITCGGVMLEDVDEKTMKSKIVEGLYFSGEVLDYQGPCGGYNLNNAWKTGIIAGLGLSRNEI